MKAKASHIDKHAVVSKKAKIAEGVTVGPFAIIEAGAVIGKNCHIHSHAVIKGSVVLEENVSVHEFSIIGGLPQSVHFKPETPSGVRIGKNTVIRELSVIHRATVENGVTSVGENCFLMSNSHLGHDCVIRNHVILASGVLIAGHVQMDDYVFIGGGTGIHQFVRVGEGAIISGNARIAHDVPPFAMAAERDEAHGLNLIGMKRRGLGNATMTELKRLYKSIILKKGDPVAHAAHVAKNEPPTTREGILFIEFFVANRRRYIQSSMQSNRGTEGAAS